MSMIPFRKNTALMGLILLGLCTLAKTSAAELANHLDQSQSSQLSLETLNDKEASQSKPLLILWKSELEGRHVDDTLTQGERVRFSLFSNANYRLNSVLSVKAEARLDMSSETVQSAFEDYSSKNGVFLREAAVNFSPKSFLTLKAGAINQEFLQAPLLLADKSFPALVEILEFKSSTGKMQLIAQQAIPSSETLGTRTNEVEPSPSLNTASIIGMSDVKALSVSAHVTYFDFSQLPSQVATESQILGNTVLPNTLTGDEFVYRFAGIETGFVAQLQMTEQTALKVGTSYLENMRAPKDINKGQMIFSQLHLDQITSVSLRPRIIYFINQSDSSPAYYNSGVYGHNNRSGLAFELFAHFLEPKFKVGFKYVESRLINDQPFQPNQNYFLIMIGTEYAEI